MRGVMAGIALLLLALALLLLVTSEEKERYGPQTSPTDEAGRPAGHMESPAVGSWDHDPLLGPRISVDVDDLTGDVHAAQDSDKASPLESGGDNGDDVSTAPPLDGPLPVDPATKAPAITTSVATSLHAATQFLYSGDKPIQTGVEPERIEPARVAVVRGRVLDRDNQPLGGVTVSVHNRPEFGQTLSRADGHFDLVVNGGGTLILNYVRAGFLPAQRQMRVPWRDYMLAETVVLLQPDRRVSVINLNDTEGLPVAQGRVVEDADGRRQPALFIPPGTRASRLLDDGRTETLETLSLRFTEYTQGDNGPSAMPGPLPPNVGYTYALEISADEAAVKQGGKDVLFDRAVPFYVDNFLGFPVGGNVPMGYYDRDRAAWIPSENGRVIEIIGITDGHADLDLTGGGMAADAEALAAMGITDGERKRLATLYAVGTSLWRVPITHLSTWDCNWPFGPPRDATAWDGDAEPATGLMPDACGAGRCPSHIGCVSTAAGSVIECENQVLGQRIPLVGTALALNYRSDRMSGWQGANSIRVSLSGTDVPASLKRIEAWAEVAGRRFDLGTFPPVANQVTQFQWDGVDAYGRHLSGTQSARVSVAYVYEGEYQEPADGRAFGRASGVAISGSRTRQEITLERSASVPVGRLDLSHSGVAGWSLDVHHAYDLQGHTLYKGDGSRRSAEARNTDLLKRIAGVASGNPVEDGQPALSGRLSRVHDIVMAPDGSLYFIDGFRIRRMDASGKVETVAGDGNQGFSGDDGPAQQASLYRPQSLALGPDGSLYFTEASTGRVRRVSPDGIITTFAGGGTGGDNGPAVDADIGKNPAGLVVSGDGSVYIVQGDIRGSVRKVTPDGIISTVAGRRHGGLFDLAEGEPATQAVLYYPHGAALGPDGSLYLAVRHQHRIRRIGPDGIITTVAGSGSRGFSGDGGPAVIAELNRPTQVAVGGDGTLFIVDQGNRRVRRVGPRGIITTLAGNGDFAGGAGEEGLAAEVGLQSILGGFAISPEGRVLFAGRQYSGLSRGAVWELRNALAQDFGSTMVASDDGDQMFLFSAEGRHQATLNTLTGATLYTFDYDSNGLLTRIINADDNVLTIERDTDGHPAALVAPFGQRTSLVASEGQLSRVENPAGDVHRMEYEAGMLTHFVDPNGHAARYHYDDLGRLVQASDPTGASQFLVRTHLPRGQQVTRTTALGRSTQYRIQHLESGTHRRVITAPDGTETVTDIGGDGRAVVTSDAGAVQHTTEGVDPRFGLQSPLHAEDVLLTGGLTRTIRRQVELSPSRPEDLLSFESLHRTLEINGHRHQAVFEQASRRNTVTSAAGRQSYQVLDAVGRVVEAGQAGLAPLLLTFDDQGRATAMHHGNRDDARRLRFAYTTQGDLSEVTDALGRTASLTHDAVGRPTSQTLADGGTTRFSYDANGNLTRLVPPGRPAHGFTYDARNRITAYSPPPVAGSGHTQTRYHYNADGQLTLIQRPDGENLQYAYDTAGRIATLEIPAGLYGFRHDPSTGLLNALSGPGGVELDYQYDDALLTAKRWKGPVQGSVEYGYDDDLRLSEIRINGREPIPLRYDADSLLIGAGALRLSRDDDNGLLTATALNNLSERYHYNDFGEVIRYSAHYGDTKLLTFNYQRDALGRIIELAETVAGARTSRAYRFDAVGQLVEVHQDGRPVAGYRYDANGNRLSHTASGTTESATHDDQDRLLRYGDAIYTYTANGELVSRRQGDATTNYDYDALGNLRRVELPDGRTIEYLIDPRNRRIGKRIDDTLVQGWIYQGQLQPVAELDGDGSVVTHFVYATGGNVPDYLIRDDATYRLVKDYLGSPRLVVSTTTGAIAQRLDYDEFGRVTLDTNPGFQPFGFAGGLYDSDTGLVRFGARDYDAHTGRWTVKDPIGFLGDGPNLYGYSLNDAINRRDSDGRFSDPVSTALIGKGLIGVGIRVCVANPLLGAGLMGVGVIVYMSPWADAVKASELGENILEKGVRGSGPLDFQKRLEQNTTPAQRELLYK